MSEEKERPAAEILHAVEREDIEENGNLIGTVMYKPMRAIYIVIATGIIIIAAVRNFWAILLGGFVIGIALIVLFNLKDYKVMEVYDDAFIVYAEAGGTKAARVVYDEIREWGIVSESAASTAIMFKLNDGQTFYKNTFRTGDAYKYLFKVMPEKESRQIQMAKNREKKLVFRNPFKNWFKK